MIGLSIHLDGDNCWPDMRGTEWLKGQITSIARLKEGTQQGNSSIAVRIKLEDGREVIAETTYKLFAGAALAFQVAEEREKP